jgi:hypothetical protein
VRYFSLFLDDVGSRLQVYLAVGRLKHILLYSIGWKGSVAMTIIEIEQQIRSLSSADKIHLIQSIAQMLRPNDDEILLKNFSEVVDSRTSFANGSLEAYGAAEQLQRLIKEESV